MTTIIEAIAPEHGVTLEADSDEAMLDALELAWKNYPVASEWHTLTVHATPSRSPEPQMPQVVTLPGIVCSTSDSHVTAKFKSLLGEYGEFLPIVSEKNTYDFFHCTNVLEDVFDAENSEPLIDDYGEVFSYGWKSFHKDRLPIHSAFTLPNNQPGGPFFTMSLVDALRKELDTRGIRFVSPWNSKDGPTRWLDV